MLRLVLVDDHPIVRAGLRNVLGEIPGLTVVGEAGAADQAVEVTARTAADVVVLDDSLPDADVPSVIRRLKARSPEVRVLVLTVHDGAHHVARALDAGAHGAVMKSGPVSTIVEAVQRIQAGDVFVTPGVVKSLLGLIHGRRGERTGVDRLSPKEYDVLHALASGKSLKECAAQLDVAVSTASTYRSRLMEKLGLRTTADIIRYGLDTQLVA